MSYEHEIEGGHSREFKRSAIRMGRALGASPAARAAMEEADEKAIWTGGCTKCRKILKGTLEQLRNHKCDG